MSAQARNFSLVVATLLPFLPGGVALACPDLPCEVATSGEWVEFVRATPEEEVDEDWSTWVEALEVLRHGARDEKRALFDRLAYGETPLYGIDLPPGDDEAETRRALEELAELVAAEQDDWLVERIAAALVEEEIEGSSVVFQALAGHPVPGVRARVAEYAESDVDFDLLPTLEAMWAVERVPVVQARLLDALAALDSDVHVSACSELLERDDHDLASAAIRCVGRGDDPDAARRLLDRARRGDTDLRVEALAELDGLLQRYQPSEAPLSALVGAAEDLWRNGVDEAAQPALLRVLETLRSPRALEIASELARGSGPLVEEALAMIGRASDPSLLPLLEAHAQGGPLETRVAAVRALGSFEALPPTVDRLLEEALAPSQPLTLRLAALAAMTGGPPASRLRSLSWLETLVVSDSDEAVRALAQAAATALENGIEGPFVTSCVIGGFPKPERFELVAPEGAASLRCHRVPGEEPAPDQASRVDARGSFEPLDRYDDLHATWRLLELEDETPCWLPDSSLRRLTASPADHDERMLSKTELDLALDDVDSPAFARLADAGVVEVLDRGATLAGVRLIDEAPDEEALEALRGADEWDGTALGVAIQALLARSGTVP